MKRSLFFLILIATASILPGESFRFRYHPGEKYRILSTVKEDVFINKRFSHAAEILNRITVEVQEAKDGTGLLSCTFHTSEESRSARELFSWGQMYESRFQRDALGYYRIEPRYFMPIVRNVPVFPEKEIFPGDTWSAAGEEVHDFRAAFGISEAVRFPIDVSYRYEGTETKDGREYHVIGIGYTVYHRPEFRSHEGRMYPVLIAGFSRQKLFWDSVRGRPYAYEENFEFLFNLSSGDSVEYRGTAEAKVVGSDLMDKDLLARDIKKDLAEMGVRDTDVKSDDLGVTLVLENIQFPPDSAILVPVEMDKLDRIGAILKKYPDRDLLVTGHTALARTAEGRRKLSEERAAAVGSYLLRNNVRPRDRMIYRGMGAEVPVADNTSEAGRIKNRRVEITILEN